MAVNLAVLLASVAVVAAAATVAAATGHLVDGG